MFALWLATITRMTYEKIEIIKSYDGSVKENCNFWLMIDFYHEIFTHLTSLISNALILFCCSAS